MSFLFKSKPKSPTELVKTIVDAMQKNKLEEVAKCLVTIKILLFGEGESEPQLELVGSLAQEMYSSDALVVLVDRMNELDFESRKNVVHLFNNLLRRQIASRLPTVDYLCSKPKLLFTLVSGYKDHEVALNCGMILRECIRHESLAKILIVSTEFYDLFEYCQATTFDIASDAFATLKELLTKHKSLVATFLDQHYELVFVDKYKQLLLSENYVTKRVSLKLLGELILDRSNYTIMTRYISNPENLKMVMNMLRDKSRNIQFEAFHVFKVFVANPYKPSTIADILLKNKEKLVAFLGEFHNDRTDDEQFNDEKAFLIRQIEDLK